MFTAIAASLIGIVLVAATSRAMKKGDIVWCPKQCKFVAKGYQFPTGR